MKIKSILGVFIVLAFNCKQKVENIKNSSSSETKYVEKTENTKPLFRNSIVSTDIDFITSTDPDAFLSLVYIGQDTKEMPGAENDELFDENTYVFKATFKNNKKVEIWAHSDFGSKAAAKIYVDKLTDKLGKLPNFMREALHHVVIHKGDSTAFAEDAGKFFVLYSDNMDTRISNNDLEETVFHESIHVALDLLYAKSKDWKTAQTQDNTYITAYAESKPKQEDLAETAIFVYTMEKYPGRLSSDIETWIKTNVPHRYAFLKAIFTPKE